MCQYTQLVLVFNINCQAILKVKECHFECTGYGHTYVFKTFSTVFLEKNICVHLLLFNTKKMLIDIVYFPISSIILMLLNKYIFNFITRCLKLKLKNENELE